MLTKIIDQKKIEVESIVLPETNVVEGKSLYQALFSSKRKPALIAEIKKASPSKGVIRKDFRVSDIASAYKNVGVDAISVLTDEKFFQGSIHYLQQVKSIVDVPVLRKDFIIDSKQIEQSVRIGADAILLIGEVLETNQLVEYYHEAYEKGLECLVEVHSLQTLEDIIKKFEPKILGVNNRDLNTFSTDIKQTKELSNYIPKNSILVSESGIHTNDDLKAVESYGANAVLIGEAFMKFDNPGFAIKALYGE